MHFVFIAFSKNSRLFRQDPSFIYRCENLSYGLENLGHTTELIHISNLTFLTKGDVFIFHRPKYLKKFLLMFQFLKLKRKLLIADVDDLIFDPHYAEESPAYVNGILSLKKIKKQFKKNFLAFEYFSHFTVSTITLKKHLNTIFPAANVAIIHNAVFDKWKDIREVDTKKSSSKVISYFPGTKSHDKDFKTISNVLESFLLKHQDIKLHITGPLNYELNLPSSQIVYNQKVPFEKHWQNYLDVWVNLAPLEDTSFTRSKSALKIIEAGFFNVPTIMFEIPDSERFVDRGALLYKEAESVVGILERLLDETFYNTCISGLKERILDIADVNKTATNFLNFVEDTLSRKIAQKRRNKGLYDKVTLRYFIKSWHINRKPLDYLNFCLFCRDLGSQLSSVRKRKLLTISSFLNNRERKKAFSLLSEDANESFYQKPFLKIIFNNQEKWLEGFRQYILKQKTICIVGNSASIRQKQFGLKIDQHDCVIRFNNCCVKGSETDLGLRNDVWVSAPDLAFTLPTTWNIVSGPNMIYKGANWKRFKKIDFNTQSVLSVPLFVWKELVSILEAPPSAGLLMIYWVYLLRESWDQMYIIGFDLNEEFEVYHYADDNHKAGIRHNWKKEKELLKLWLSEGLKVLT